MSTRQQLAAQNREELLNAAIHVFRIHGINAPLQLIMDQANVNDRRDLVLALMEDALNRLEARANNYAQFEDGFIRLIQDHIYNIPYLTALMEYWRVIDRADPVMIEIYQRRDAILQPLIDQSIANGTCRTDFKAADYAMVTSILRSALQGHTEADQEKLAKRAVEFLLHGICG